MDFLIIAALIIYATYHVASRSDIFKDLRDWARCSLPKWMTYPLSCCFCWTVHCCWISTLLAWFWTGYLSLSIGYLLAVPVINLVLDLVVQHLIRLNSPPVIITNVDFNDRKFAESLSARIKQVAIQTLKEQMCMGGTVDAKFHTSYGGTSTPQVVHGDGEKIPPSMTVPDAAKMSSSWTTPS